MSDGKWSFGEKLIQTSCNESTTDPVKIFLNREFLCDIHSHICLKFLSFYSNSIVPISIHYYSKMHIVINQQSIHK